MPALVEASHADFLSPDFDPNEFAHRVLDHHAAAAQPALAKLDYGIQDLSHQLRQLVHAHHPTLLLQAASLTSVAADLAEVRTGLNSVQASVTRLNHKVKLPHQELEQGLQLLERTRAAARLARTANRFVVLARRLQQQMQQLAVSSEGQDASSSNDSEKTQRATAEAALTLAELDSLLSEGVTPPADRNPNATNAQPADQAAPPPPPPATIRNLDVVVAQLAAVEQAREFVVERMETSVQRALETLDQPLLASSLQTAHNLSVLPQLVDNLVQDVCDKLVQERVTDAFDMAAVAKAVAGHKDAPTTTTTTTNAAAAVAFMYKSRSSSLRTEPTASTLPQWQSTFWDRLERLVIDEVGNACVRVYALEKVLRVKRDQVSQESFLDEALTVLDNKPSALFWTSLTRALELHTRETARTSTFIQSTMSTSYPRLLRLFQEFFSKIAVHTDTVYTLAQQSPETILTLRAIQPFENLYLTRSRNRLNEAVMSAFSLAATAASSQLSQDGGAAGGAAGGGGGGAAAVPTASGGLMLARAVVNELDAARFDPLLAKAVAKGSARAIDAFVNKAEALIARDHAATSLIGPLATPSQLQNADLTSALYHLWLPLERALGDHIEGVRESLRSSVDRTRSTYLAIVNPLILAIRREFSSLLARMHRTNYYAAGDGGDGGVEAGGGGGASAYMTDLTDKLLLVKEEILGAYRVGELARDWALDLARFIVQTFLLHASLLRVGEAGKLRLTNDVTTLEFAVTQYLSAHGLALNSMGDQFKAVRGKALLPYSLPFRPLLFRDLSTLGDSAQTGDVPTLILLHHVLARGGLPLPHQVRGWSETEYVRWLNEHQEEERIRLIEEVVEREREKEREKEKASPNGRAQQEEEETGGDKEEVEAAAEESETGRVALEIVSKVLARGTSSGNAARR
ncbi:hypothetical protein B0A53_01768 [Rhodotorula sp. CCFEE 5036]|nr:hypothetical protein B0A53_01768 [Rhodotorula sp. CCFEE 5036]